MIVSRKAEQLRVAETCVTTIERKRVWVKLDDLTAAEVNPIHERYGRPEITTHAVDWTDEYEDPFLNNANSFMDVDEYCENDGDCFREICLESSNPNEEPEPAEDNGWFIDCRLFKPKLNFARREKVGNKSILTVASFGLTFGGF